MCFVYVKFFIVHVIIFLFLYEKKKKKERKILKWTNITPFSRKQKMKTKTTMNTPKSHKSKSTKYDHLWAFSKFDALGNFVFIHHKFQRFFEKYFLHWAFTVQTKIENKDDEQKEYEYGGQLWSKKENSFFLKCLKRVIIIVTKWQMLEILRIEVLPCANFGNICGTNKEREV